MSNKYETDWKNIKLDSSEKKLNIIDPFSFEDFIILAESNLEEITEESLLKEFRDYTLNKQQETREVFHANLKNLTAFMNKKK